MSFVDIVKVWQPFFLSDFFLSFELQKTRSFDVYKQIILAILKNFVIFSFKNEVVKPFPYVEYWAVSKIKIRQILYFGNLILINYIILTTMMLTIVIYTTMINTVQ